MNFIKREWLTIVGVCVGFAGGYLYWWFVGCNSGSCPIASSPILSSIWGGLVGGLLFSIFRRKRRG